MSRGQRVRAIQQGPTSGYSLIKPPGWAANRIYVRGMLKSALIVLSAVSALAMLYVGAYQIRAIEHMSCPLLKHGCEAVADAPFARPFGIPDGFIAAAMYGLLILLAVAGPQMTWTRYSLRALASAGRLPGERLGRV